MKGMERWRDGESERRRKVKKAEQLVEERTAH